MNSRAQIVATIGPASEQHGVLELLIKNNMDVARLNFAWLDAEEGGRQIEIIRTAALKCGRVIPIIADLPGPRVQLTEGHTYDASQPFSITQKSMEILEMCRDKQVEYVALSFVGSAADVGLCREAITKLGGTQKIIAKIERKIAVDNCDGIIAAADAIMVARGDLGAEVPLEEIPFIQKMLIAKANAAGKPVITATQMLLSMTAHAEPTRAEVTDVEAAIMDGSDAVMLSEETASGSFPVEAVAMMERILVEAEKHRGERAIHLL
jgi:pyruvate kinase